MPPIARAEEHREKRIRGVFGCLKVVKVNYTRDTRDEVYLPALSNFQGLEGDERLESKG